MNLVELDRSLRKLRLSGMANTLEVRLRQAQAERMAGIDLLSALVQDELTRRQDRLLARRIKDAEFRDTGKTLDSFDSCASSPPPRPRTCSRSSCAATSAPARC